MTEILRIDFLVILFINGLFVSNYINFCEANEKHDSVATYGITESNTLDVENPNQKNNFKNLSDKFNKKKSERNRKFRKWMKKEVDIIGDTTMKQEDVECHRAAVWKCGHRFIRAHKFVDFIGSRDSFEPKCALRTAFFVCLKSSKTKYCHKHKSQHTEKFRKRLADTLWSTRACLLGVRQ